MNLTDNILKFLRYSSMSERAGLELYERLPRFIRERFVLGPGFIRWAAILRDSENWDSDRIRTFQVEQLRALLSHAGKNVPYYRKLFNEHGFRPELISAPEDLRALPFLDRAIVRDHPHEFIDELLPRQSLHAQKTSGSSGVPLAIYRTQEVRAGFLAFRADFLRRIGHKPGCREVMFWNMIDLGKRKNLPFLYYGNKLILSNRHLTAEWLDRYSGMVRRFNPEFLLGYPSALSVFTAFLRERPVHLPKLRAVISYSEPQYDWQRELTETVFNVRGFSVYAMTEAAVMGSSCEHVPDIHISPLYGATEIVPVAGEISEIIGTGFANTTMPLIRYRTGDLLSEVHVGCQHCGRSHLVTGNVNGRVNDFLIARGGEVIPRLMPWIETFPNVSHFQFFQEEPGKARLRLVRTSSYTSSDTAFIRSKLTEMLGPMKDAVDIEIVFVDDIGIPPSGKALMVEQRLDIRSFLNMPPDGNIAHDA